MFLRPLIELSEFVAEKAGTPSVEVYYRVMFSERNGKIGSRKAKGIRAFTRLRWQRDGLEYSVGFGGFLPDLPLVASLIELASPGKMELPVPSGRMEKRFSISSSRGRGANVAGWFRDIVVTASGIRLSAEGKFGLFEDENGLWNEKPEWTGRPGGEKILLSPQTVLFLFHAGLLKDIACKKPARGFLHHAFDRIGGKEMNRSRTPDNLDILSAAIGLAIPTGTATGGRCCRRVALNRDGTPELFFENTKNFTVHHHVLKSMKKVSKEFQLFQNGILFYLPWVELDGGEKWALH
ncbi:MAG: hypothetical protein GXO69_01560 [Acidobacteria bacterium]|nr:hypothetical protein [Acidobacteriota bacterium]